MTTPAPEQQPVAQTAPVTVEAAPGSALANALARYSDLKAAADAAKSALSDCTDLIKAEGYAAMEAQQPGQARGVIRDPAGIAPPLALTYSTSTRLDSTRLKRDHPDFWESYSKTSGSWGLREVGSKGGE